MEIELVVLAACIAAGLGRALLPYIRKLKDAEETGSEIEFSRKYIFTTVYAVVISMIVGLLAYPAIIGTVPSEGALIGVFITAFVGAWGLSDIFNQVTATGSSGSSSINKAVKLKEDNPQ